MHEHEQPEREREELEAAAGRIRKRMAWTLVGVGLGSTLLAVGAVNLFVVLGLALICAWGVRQWREIHADDPAYDRFRRAREPRERARWTTPRRSRGEVLPAPREPWRSERWIGEQTRLGLQQLEEFLQRG